MRRSARDFIADLMQRRDVIEEPERAALGGHDQVLAMHGNVGDRGEWQVELQRLPAPAIIERNVDAELGAGI